MNLILSRYYTFLRCYIWDRISFFNRKSQLWCNLILWVLRICVSWSILSIDYKSYIIRLTCTGFLLVPVWILWPYYCCMACRVLENRMRNWCISHTRMKCYGLMGYTIFCRQRETNNIAILSSRPWGIGNLGILLPWVERYRAGKRKLVRYVSAIMLRRTEYL